jgi:PAS domain S-box-containing protein
LKNQKKPALLNDLDIYSKIFNSISNPIFVKNPDHRFVLVNNAFCEFFNVKYEDFVGKKDDEIFPKREWKIYREKDIKILTTGEPDENEEYTTVPGGKRLRVMTKKSLLQTSGGEKYVLGIVTDITEKTELLKKIRESEKKYKLIFDLGSDPSALFNFPKLTAVDLNASFIKISNIKKSRIIGKRANHIFSWIDPVERQIYFNLLVKERKVDNMEIHLRLRDGPAIPFLVSARMFIFDKKNYILFSLRDISDLKRAEQSLKESEILHKAFFNISPNLIIIHYNGVIVFINQAVVDFFGQKSESIIGKRLSEFLKIKKHPSGRKDVNKYLTDLLIRSSSVELEIANPEGKWTDFLLRNAKIKYAGNDAIMSILVDITERKNFEQIVLNRTIAVEENEHKRFATDLHDDLGPILSSIKIYLRIMQKTRDPVKQEEALGIFEQLLNEVIYKVHRISHYLTPQLIDDFGLEASVKNLCQIIGNNEDFTINFKSNLKKARFQNGIELHFYRIISELINNSIKYSQGKNMEIEIYHHDDILRLKYCDDGIGYNVKKILKKTTGIGISNIIQRVNLMKGDIDFNRINGKTEVTIQIRISDNTYQQTFH